MCASGQIEYDYGGGTGEVTKTDGWELLRVVAEDDIDGAALKIAERGDFVLQVLRECPLRLGENEMRWVFEPLALFPSQERLQYQERRSKLPTAVATCT